MGSMGQASPRFNTIPSGSGGSHQRNLDRAGAATDLIAVPWVDPRHSVRTSSGRKEKEWSELTSSGKASIVWDRNRWTILYIAVVVTAIFLMSLHELLAKG
jgi:hypothetical protein